MVEYFYANPHIILILNILVHQNLIVNPAFSYGTFVYVYSMGSWTSNSGFMQIVRK